MKHMNRMLYASFLFIVLVFGVASLGMASEKEWFLNSYTIQGQRSPELKSMLDEVAVQQLLLDIANQPRPREYIAKILASTSRSIEDLIKFKLIRKQKKVFVINYLLFTNSDIHRMREITESHALKLANSLLKRKHELEKIMSGYTLPGVDSRAALYVMLGCFSLDWDGLAITAERGYRLKRGEDSRLINLSWEPSGLSKKEFYKGSHNNTIAGITLTSFGDHEIQPRKALPDILWRIPSQMSHLKYPDGLKSKIKNVIGELVEEIGGSAARLMMALRTGPKKVADLARLAEIRPGMAVALVELLETLRYIKKDDGVYRSRIPLLDQQDASLVKEVMNIGYEEMIKWFDEDYKRLKKELSELTPFRYGVAQKDYFFYIWHDIFGAANRILVKAGVFSDPYSEVFNGEGIIPVVFLSSLCDPLKL